MEPLFSWVWLSLCLVPGSGAFAKLWERFGSAEQILLAQPQQIRRCIGSSERACELLCEASSKRQQAQHVYEFCMRHKVGLLPYDDVRFPESLRSIAEPPALLYYRGTLPDFSVACPIAVVGTRRMTRYGKRFAFCVSADLARAGAVIVSGMALGVDGTAHAGALFAGAPTVAVLGCGIDRCYPAEHLQLARNIVRDGCILTEYAPGVAPAAHHFPTRNRLIAGLCEATVVIEGAQRSGALLTARHAQKQGKPVYALPGDADSPGSALTGLLLREGARPFLCADDIIRDREKSSPGKLNPFVLPPASRYDPAQTEQILARFGACCTTVRRPGEYRRKNGEQPDIGQETSPAQHPAGAPYRQPEKAERQHPFPSEQLAQCGALAEQIYRQIPSEGDVSVESLITDGMCVATLMSTLLKMEVRALVQMLPGERIRRA